MPAVTWLRWLVVAADFDPYPGFRLQQAVTGISKQRLNKLCRVEQGNGSQDAASRCLMIAPRRDCDEEPGAEILDTSRMPAAMLHSTVVSAQTREGS